MYRLSDLLYMLGIAWTALAGGFTLLAICWDQELPVIWYWYVGICLLCIYTFAKCAKSLERHHDDLYSNYRKSKVAVQD